MTSNVDSLRKWLGIRKSKGSKTTIIPAKRKEPEFETPQQKAMRDALHREQRNYQRYLDARTARLHKLQTEVPAVARYLRRLELLTEDVATTSTRDCDIDLGGVAAAYKLRERITRPYDRFLVLECTCSWLRDIAKSQGITSIDDPDPLPFDPPTPTAIDDLKTELGLA